MPAIKSEGMLLGMKPPPTSDRSTSASSGVARASWLVTFDLGGSSLAKACAKNSKRTGITFQMQKALVRIQFSCCSAPTSLGNSCWLDYHTQLLHHLHGCQSDKDQLKRCSDWNVRTTWSASSCSTSQGSSPNEKESLHKADEGWHVPTCQVLCSSM